MVKINGEFVPANGIKLTDYLAENNYNIKRIAVEINEEIVPKSMYEETILNDGDTVEVVTFVAGG